MAWEPPANIALRDAYYDVMKKITHRNWNHFARSALQLDQNDIDEIRDEHPRGAREQKFWMFQKWAENVGSAVSVELLYATLNHYLFPNKCPKPDIENMKAYSGTIATGKRGCLGADATAFATEPSDIPLADYCSQVTRIDIRECNDQFLRRNINLGSNYARTRDRGKVFIINNEFSHHGDNARHGSKVDVANMKKLWEGFGCSVQVESDLHANDIKKLLKNFSDECESSNYCVVFIMSHGEEDAVLGNDNEKVPYKDIFDMFNNENARHLHGIPKVFFFQCCRGSEADTGVPVSGQNERLLENSYTLQPGATGGSVSTDAAPTREKLPTTSDMLIAYATQHGKQAFRHTENGSWFVNAIANVFMHHAREEHILDLMTKVNNAVAAKSANIGNNEAKAMSHVEFTLCKKLYLYPGR